MVDPRKKKVAVGLSGGVDSTVAALLLQRQGYEAIGLTMSIWDGSLALPDEGRSGCYGPGEARDIEAARQCAARLGIPHHTIPLAAEYKKDVLDYFRREYRAGRTPNPCVMCNRHIKFGLLVERALQQGLAFDRFATGHYARIEADASSGQPLLKRGIDPAKDQSYFLCRLPRARLAQILFPLGGMTKKQVRAVAREAGWADLADKQESQDFIESRDYDVLFEPGDERPGPIVDMQGREVGRHRGIVHYTIGQRKGLGLGGTAEPLYVARLDGHANTVTVGSYRDLFARRFVASAVNWLSPDGPSAGPLLRADVKIRQQHRAAPATVRASAADCVTVEFDEPQMSITPGQTAVFYNGDVVLGGGTIEATQA